MSSNPNFSPLSNSSGSPSNIIPNETIDNNNQTLSPELLAEQRSQWLSRLLTENPQILALRERILPWTGGYSFSNIVHTDSTAVLNHVNRHVILELVYQHLNAIGMHKTAETIQKESGHDFQLIDQPWDKTSLLILVSLGVLPREDPWNILPDPHYQFVEESLEEDFFSFPYREDPSLMYIELLNPNSNIIYITENNFNFSNLRAASLRRLVLLLVSSPLDLFPDDERYAFFLTLHSITSSHHFFEHLMTLFDCHLLEPSNIEDKKKILEIQPQIRSEVINLIKKWTNFHGLFIGKKTLKSIGQFLRRINDDSISYQNLQKFAKPLLSQLPSLSYGMKQGKLSEPEDKPIIPDPQIIFKPTLKLIEPDSLELARQITLMFQQAFKAVHSREFVVALGEQRVSHQTPTLSEFFEFGERLTLLTLETIVLSQDPTSTILKILDIAIKLEELANFDALACIIRALRSEELNNSSIFINNPNLKINIQLLYSKCGDDPKTRESYSSVVLQRFNSWSPTIPNLRVELISLISDRSPSFVDGLINWGKRKGISEKTAILYRFQNRSYNYWPIPQIQKMVKKGSNLTLNQIYLKIDQLNR